MRVSFSTYTNFLQCPFRVWLLSFKPTQTLFHAQYEGLYVHEYVERRLRQEINGEDVPLDKTSINQSIFDPERERIPDVDFENIKIDLSRIEEHIALLLGFLREQKVHTVETEKKLERRKKVKDGSMMTVSGVVDVICHTADLPIVLDLKFSNHLRGYTAHQLVLYSWLLEKLKPKAGYLVFMKDNFTIKEFEIKDTHANKQLKHILDTLEYVYLSRKYDLLENFAPNMAHRTCHPNRCGVYYMCPYGGLDIPDTPYWETEGVYDA